MTQELLEKLYNNPDELEKMAQEQQAVNDALDYLHKCAEEGGIDISQLSPEQQLELYNALVSEIQGEGEPEVAEGQPVASPAAPAAVSPEQPAMQAPAPEMSMTPEMQQKIAENMYFSEMFGKNAAHTYWRELQTLSKEASVTGNMGAGGLIGGGLREGVSSLGGKALGGLAGLATKGTELARNPRALALLAAGGALAGAGAYAGHSLSNKLMDKYYPEKEAAEQCDDEKHKGSPTFEAMAMAKAKKMKEEHSKTAAFETLLQHRAEELLASGQV